MKKAIVLFCAVLMLSVLFGCQKAPADTGASDTDAVDTAACIAFADQLAANRGAQETLAGALVRQLDGAYDKEAQLPEASSTVGMVALADKYAAQWQQIAEGYYAKIMAYEGGAQVNGDTRTAEELHRLVADMKTDWEAYNQKQCENYAELLKTVYNGGSIIGPALAHYKYARQKEWALQMVGIYQQLNVE